MDVLHSGASSYLTHTLGAPKRVAEHLFPACTIRAPIVHNPGGAYASASMGKLTTHVLNLTAGIPAAGMRVDLHDASAGPPRLLTQNRTNEDGRCGQPLLNGASFRGGRYTLTFHVAEYFRTLGVQLPDPPFIDEVVIQFGVADPSQNYHVPLLVSPWSYSTYRGS